MTLIDFGGRGELEGMVGFSAEDRIEAWTAAIAQANTLFDCTRLDYDCIHAIEIAVKRGRLVSPSIHQAQALLAERRAQIIAAMKPLPPSAPGGSPAPQGAHGPQAPAIKEHHQW